MQCSLVGSRAVPCPVGRSHQQRRQLRRQRLWWLLVQARRRMLALKRAVLDGCASLQCKEGLQGSGLHGCTCLVAAVSAAFNFRLLLACASAVITFLESRGAGFGSRI